MKIVACLWVGRGSETGKIINHLYTFPFPIIYVCCYCRISMYNLSSEIFIILHLHVTMQWSIINISRLFSIRINEQIFNLFLSTRQQKEKFGQRNISISRSLFIWVSLLLWQPKNILLLAEDILCFYISTFIFSKEVKVRKTGKSWRLKLPLNSVISTQTEH